MHCFVAGRTTRVPLLILCIVIASLYLSVACLHFLAYTLANSGDAAHLELASRVEPGNAELRYKLGRSFSSEQKLIEALKAFKAATVLNPHNPEYWLELAAIERILGQSGETRQSLEKALAASPTDSTIAFSAANSYLADSDLPAAFHSFREALQGSPSLSGYVFSVCWASRPDVSQLLQEALPENSDVYSAFLEFLLSKKENASAELVWARMIKFKHPVSTQVVMDYIHYLVQAREPEIAEAVWKDAAQVTNLNAYQPSSANLIVNGDFRQNILNSAFDWTYQRRPDLSLEIDPLQTFNDSPSLLIEYNSAGVEDSGVHHLIVVEPHKRYNFSASFKSQKLEAAGGPRFSLRDFYSHKPFFQSDTLKDSESWKAFSGSFETGSETQLIDLLIENELPGAAIRGKLWISRVRLVPADEKAAN